MKRRIIILSLVTAISLATAGFAALRVTSAPEARAAVAVEVEPTSSVGAYTLRPYNGKIAVFTGAFLDEPAILTDIEVWRLREYDRKLLERGIPAATYDDVLRLFEDFSS
ncbi:MAG: hypothetical protein LBN30_01080 [Oscillospiraceae bacterium]|jgi:hypothetical protein|nr:hypothetical protein [Oscillospiraceae bacterium]